MLSTAHPVESRTLTEVVIFVFLVNFACFFLEDSRSRRSELCSVPFILVYFPFKFCHLSWQRWKTSRDCLLHASVPCTLLAKSKDYAFTSESVLF